VVPVAAEIGDGFGEGLEAAVGDDVPPQLTASSADAIAPVIDSFACIHPDTEPGYGEAYSGVTYAAVNPPSTRNVEPLT